MSEPVPGTKADNAVPASNALPAGNGRLRRLQPSASVMSGAVGGTPLALILVWVLNSYVLPAPMPGEIAVAIGSLVASCVGYLTRGGRRDVPSHQ